MLEMDSIRRVENSPLLRALMEYDFEEVNGTKPSFVKACYDFSIHEYKSHEPVHRMVVVLVEQASTRLDNLKTDHPTPDCFMRQIFHLKSSCFSKTIK
jgi:hypothetical protein